MPRENRALARDVIEDVRSACQQSGRATTEAEVQRTLEPLDAQQVDAVRRLARGGLTAPLGPDALVDVVEGTPVHVASAREVGGYYAMKAERDALATVAAHTQGLPASATESENADESPLDEDDYEDDDDDVSSDPWDDDSDDLDFDADEDDFVFASHPHDVDDDDDDAVEAARFDAAGDADDFDEDDEYEPEEEAVAEVVAPKPRAPKRRGPKTQEEREQEQVLTTLFAYHRDAVRVAQELGIGLQELSDRIDHLSLRRRIHRLLEQTTDIDMFLPSKVASGNPEPVVRKRGQKVPRPSEDEELAPSAVEFSSPAAQTDPVNAHGTRVYRRSPDATSPRPMPSVELAQRREYVREPKRRVRTTLPKVQKRPAALVAPPKPPARPSFTELQAFTGKAILEKLLADEKANPRVLARKLAERFEGPAGRDINDSDLRSLLSAHGLSERFAEREFDNTRFMIGFHQGARSKLANALLMNAEELDAYLAKLKLSDELARVRTVRSKMELGRRKLQDRISQVLTRAPYLDDLGVLPVVDREVFEQLEDLFQACDGDREAVRAELGLDPNPFAKLLRRYDVAAWQPAT